MEFFNAVNYLKFSFQSNIYLTSEINKINGKNILLIGTLPRKIVSVEYDLADDKINPALREIHFAYIPVGAELVSMTAFNKSRTIDDFAIGVTLIRNTEAGTEYYLNVYCDNDITCNDEMNLENIAQNCENIELYFAPYGLYHIMLPPQMVDNKHETVWLLSGGDEKIHVYKELEEEHVHYEVSVSEFFPEFLEITGIALSVDIRYYNQYTRRISCVGYESGRFIFKVINVGDHQIIHLVSSNFEGIICEVKLFTITTAYNSYEKNVNEEYSLDMQNADSKPSIHLLVTTSQSGATVYMNILEHMLNNRNLLPKSVNRDIVTCSLAADIDLDGHNELFCGTYNQDVLIYKYYDLEEKWKLLDLISFSAPVHKLYYTDLIQDGTRQLSAITTNGIHIHQYEHRYILKVLNARMKEMLMKNKERD